MASIFKADLTEKEIEFIKANHKRIHFFIDLQDVQIYSLDYKLGTMIDSEVDAFVTDLKRKNIDLSIIDKDGKKWDTYLKTQTDSIGKGNSKCNECGTVFDTKWLIKLNYSREYLDSIGETYYDVLVCPKCKSQNIRKNEIPFNINDWVES